MKAQSVRPQPASYIAVTLAAIGENHAETVWWRA